METNKIKIAVTGGSGFIGTNLINYLLNKDISFINIDINNPKEKKHEQYWEKINILNFEDFKKVLIKFNPTHIIHLAAALGMDHNSLKSLSTNIDGVDNLIKISNTLPILEKVLFTSSLLVCKNGYIPKDNKDYCPPNYYGESKMLGEKIVFNSVTKFNWVIVRPTSIWGPFFEYSYKMFFETIDKNRYMHIGHQNIVKPASYVGNTIHMILKLVFDKTSITNQEIFYLGDYPDYSTRAWADTIQRTLNSKPIFTAPIFFLKIIAIFGDLIKIIFKYDPPLTSFRLANMRTGGEYPLIKAQSVIGKLPFNLSESVYETAKWMFDKSLIKHKPSKD